tara:strand:- start:325 stop:510 length:186 start_codon:yes stop_codon:yes gene_type:complete
MKTLKITLVAFIFCMTLTGLTIQNENSNPNNEEQVSQKEDFTYAFQAKRHIRRGSAVPTNG